MTNLSELAARVEALTGPSREIDIQIKAAIYGGVALLSPFNGEWGIYREDTSDPRTGKLLERPRSVSHEKWSNDRFTASIDAAVTLVPEGHDWSVSSEQDRGVAYTIGEGIFAADTVAKTPALALTAAALRARATTQDAK